LGTYSIILTISPSFISVIEQTFQISNDILFNESSFIFVIVK